jgi:hypothetical protein
LLHRDIAPVYQSVLVQEYPFKNGTSVHAQRPYSSDLGSDDNCQFLERKVLLKGHKLQLTEEVKEAMMVALKEDTGKRVMECF